jgi:hypothetical protein
VTWALTPIRVDIAKLKDDIAELTARVTQLYNGLKALEARTGQISRIAAIVECLTPSFYWFLTNQMQTWNHSCGSGRDSEVEIVALKSGDDPTKPPVCVLNFSPGNECRIENIFLSIIYQLF